MSYEFVLNRINFPRGIVKHDRDYRVLEKAWSQQGIALLGAHRATEIYFVRNIKLQLVAGLFLLPRNIYEVEIMYVLINSWSQTVLERNGFLLEWEDQRAKMVFASKK
ncbi:MAG TPA: hypothetical protein VD999_01645 [Vitreimonas sp.]|nr:hypothetical protein [Vitreimonas sp.]